MSLRSTLARWIGRGTKVPPADMRGNASMAVVWDSDAKASAQAERFPRFQANANDHIAPHASGRFARKRQALLEVFSPSRPVGDRKRFAGRLDVLTSLIRAIEEQKLHVVMYGARGVGKTSLLHVLTEAARDARYLVVYVSCGSDSNFDEIFRMAAAAIPMLYHATVGPTSAEVETGKTLADILPKTPVSPRLASDLLAKVVGTRLMVVLDEFDRSESKIFRRDVAEFIKNLSDRLVRVQLVIAGVAGDLVDLLEHTPSIQRNIFALRVPWMNPAEVRELVRKGGEACGLAFNEESIGVVISAAIGSPFLASLIAHRAGLNALDNGRTQVTLADAVEAIKTAANDFKGRLSKRVQAQLWKFGREGHASTLGTLGGIALKCGGSFHLEDIRNSVSGLDTGARGEQLTPQLTVSEILTEREVDGEKVYHFAEDGIAPYVWLSMALTQYSNQSLDTPVAIVRGVPRD